MKKIKIEIPLSYAIEIATYGESGSLSRLIQMSFEKSLNDLGYQNELEEVREEKTNKMFNNLSRTLGASNMKKIEDALETGKSAIRVANRMRNKN